MINLFRIFMLLCIGLSNQTLTQLKSFIQKLKTCLIFQPLNKIGLRIQCDSNLNIIIKFSLYSRWRKGARARFKCSLIRSYFLRLWIDRHTFYIFKQFLNII